MKVSGISLASLSGMAADAGKVYPSEIHLLKKEIEVQGDLISQESLERKADVYQLKLELEALKGHSPEQSGPSRINVVELLSIVAAFLPTHRAIRIAFRILGAAEFARRFRRSRE